MMFGPVALDQALGAILAHSVQAGPVRIRKGKVLAAQDIEALAAYGIREVVVARLELGELHENDAANLISEAIVAKSKKQGIRITQASVGRVNFYAEHSGLVQFQPEFVHSFNKINAMIGLATLPALRRVLAGEMIATLKIISYAVSEQDAARAAQVGVNLLSIARPQVQTATLVETRITSGHPSAKGRQAVKKRLERLGVDLTPRVVVGHEEDAIAEAISKAAGDVVLVLTASATSDIRDTAPAALCLAGGKVLHYGMPVDPGNLLFLGKIENKSVIGLPGCARSPAMNGADWILERVICGIEITPDDIARMGVGGLLKEMPSRKQPRETTRS